MRMLCVTVLCFLSVLGIFQISNCHIVVLHFDAWDSAVFELPG